MSACTAITIYILWILFSTIETSSEIIILDIDALSWTVTNSNNSLHVDARIPGNIHSDLMRSGIIENPYYRFNDVKYRWVSYDNWTYSAKFEVSREVLARQQIQLVAEGLDTAATVSINGKFLAFSDNMFIWSSWDVTKHVKEGINTISVAFTSPILYAKFLRDSLYSKYGYDQGRPACFLSTLIGQFKICYIQYIRKTQCSFGWDFGTAIPTMGIWKPMKIEAFNTCVMKDVTVNTISDVSGWVLNLSVYFDCGKIVNPKVVGTVLVLLSDAWSTSTVVPLSPASQGTSVANVTVRIPRNVKISLWWPNGFGAQTLYDLTVTFTPDTGLETTAKSLRIGFRTVELVQEPIKNAKGLTFYLKVNGVPIFMKGSNWVPADSFADKITVDYLRSLLESARDANMNVLRVWGGGMYEQDAFYDLADEFGLLVWHDMMFAVSSYAVNDDYLKSVSLEVTQQVRRLQHHPSIAAWNGNNEIELALADDWFGTSLPNHRQEFRDDYRKLFVATIMKIMSEEDRLRPFVTSSPSNGLKSIRENYLAKNPNDPLYGDFHHYDNFGDHWDWTIYTRPRFASEYGFQSWPSFETLAKVSVAEDWHFTSKFMHSRQNQMFGNLPVIWAIWHQLGLPETCRHRTIRSLRLKYLTDIVDDILMFGACNTLKDFKGIIYFSQIYQAVAVKTETELYRRSRNEIVRGGEGMTMGTLYWQLDDIYQGASWSSIEYGGKWKMLHYYAANFYSPLLISPYVDGNVLRVYLINDNVKQATFKLKIVVYRWNTLIPVSTKVSDIHSTEHFAANVFNTPVDELLQQTNCSAKECFVHFSLLNGNNFSVIGPPNFVLLSQIKATVGLRRATIMIKSLTAKANEKWRFTIVLSTDNIALFVWLEASGIRGRFSDNGFLMVTHTITIDFIAWQNTNEDELRKSLSVTSVVDFY